MGYPRKSGLTAERLREVLEYNPATGVFVWKARTARAVTVGALAGGVTNHGYAHITIDNERYVAHRLAWLYMTGAWPEEEVDHKNGLRADNRWCNLRAATTKQNRENREKAPSNTSGMRGVSWVRSRQNWLAQIKSYGVNRNLGRFPTLVDAAAARLRAEREMFTHHREY